MTRTCGSIGEEEEGRGSGPARARASGPLSERARVRGQGSVADLGSGQKAMDSCGESIAEAPGARKPRLRARGDCRALFPEVAANRLHLLHASQRRGFGSPRFGVRRAGRGRGRRPGGAAGPGRPRPRPHHFRIFTRVGARARVWRE